MFCGECGEAMDAEDKCRTCGVCEECCDCDVVADAGTFDADEFGEEPEDEYERRTRGQFIREP
jgi:hypothetical protein